MTVTQGVRVEPFFVEIDSLRQDVRNRLVQAGGDEAANAALCHDPDVTTADAVSAAILTGGQARRFGGRDKSALVIGGRTIIIRQAEVLQRLTDDLFLVGGDPDRHRDLGVPIVPDVIPGAGAVGGGVTALERARHPRVLVLACDVPFVPVTLLASLIAAAADADGAWARSPRGVEPLIACYQRRARAVVRREILAGRFALTGLADVLTIRAVDVSADDADRWLVNVNTPDDYERIR